MTKELSPAQQRLNRLKLADYIEHELSDKQFDMSTWTQPCGTVGCALGHAAMGRIIEGLDIRIEHGSIRPVICGEPLDEFISWRAAGAHFFGAETHERIFIGLVGVQSREYVAEALRGIRDPHGTCE